MDLLVNDEYHLENVQEIIKVSDEALFPIDLQTKTILLDGEVAEDNLSWSDSYED